jgi:SAM-dependent methyltransferase
MSLPRLYDDLADLWPLISPTSHYVAEVAALRRVLEDYLPEVAEGARPAVLELGAGAGRTIHHLGDGFDAVAVDLSAPMLAHCRKLNPQVPTHVGDMRSIRLDRRFDAVLAHDALDHMTTLEDLAAACDTAAAHLAPGGIFLAGPTYFAEHFVDGETAFDCCGAVNLDVDYVSSVERSHDRAPTYDLVTTLIIRRNGRLSVVEDRQPCGLFATAQWRTVLDECGFDRLEDPGSEQAAPVHLFTCRKCR